MRSFLEKTDFFGGNDPEALVKEFGSPLYVYNEDILRQSMRTLKNIITKYPYTANFSMKANSNLTILKMALEEGLNCDAMSEGEIRLLFKAGFPSDRIFYVPNNVSSEEMEYALEHNVITSLDSIDQLESFGKINRGGRCAVRLNPGVGAGHHEKVITAGKNTKFAITDDQLDVMFETAKKYDLKIVGINQHIGSLFMEPEPYLKAVRNILHMAERFDRLEFIDFGGGFGVPYHKVSEDEQPFDFDLLSSELEKILDEFTKKVGYVPLFKSEPGRYTACEGGVLLGRVHAVKNNAEKKFVGTDIGMNILVRPSLYGSWHDLEVLRDGKPVYEGERETVTVTGNICESGDIIAKDRDLPVIRTGDLICALDAGSYGYSMASNYNQRLRPAEILITSEGNVKLIRKRDTYEEMFKCFDI
ncbi:MAG: diaminopimelate decarboxylase [Clostridiales bacterium]|nr:diaminopimelate decarboxylase [Clostridiales bacterium]